MPLRFVVYDVGFPEVKGAVVMVMMAFTSDSIHRKGLMLWIDKWTISADGWGFNVLECMEAEAEA